MNVELKNVKVSEKFSEETTCFSATIYIDGKKAGVAENRGCGGPTDYHFTDSKVLAAFEAYCKGLPPLPPIFDGGPRPMDGERLIDELLGKYLDAKDKEKLRNKVRRDVAKMTVFLLKGESLVTVTDGTYSLAYRTVKAPYEPKVKDFLVRKYGDKLGAVVNEKPELIDAI